jgi:hypothetical protein
MAVWTYQRSLVAAEMNFLFDDQPLKSIWTGVFRS